MRFVTDANKRLLLAVCRYSATLTVYPDFNYGASATSNGTLMPVQMNIDSNMELPAGMSQDQLAAIAEHVAAQTKENGDI